MKTNNEFEWEGQVLRNGKLLHVAALYELVECSDSVSKAACILEIQALDENDQEVAITDDLIYKVEDIIVEEMNEDVRV